MGLIHDYGDKHYNRSNIITVTINTETSLCFVQEVSCQMLALAQEL